VSERNVEKVRGLWRAFARGGIEDVLEIADEDVVWIPYDGTVLKGHEDLKSWWRRRAAQAGTSVATAHSFTDFGDHVLVYGHVEASGSEARVFWVYTFTEDRLIRFEAFPDDASALAAMRRPRD
jgi:ketosteroid isomerase-like protein